MKELFAVKNRTSKEESPVNGGPLVMKGGHRTVHLLG